MTTSDYLEVTFLKKGNFFSSGNGVLRLRGDDLILDEALDRTGEHHEHHLPLAQIKDVELVKKLFSKKLVLKSRSRELFENLPGSDGITFEMGIKKAQYSKAQSFYKALKLRHSELIIRS